MKIVLCAGHDTVKDPGAVTKLNGIKYTEQSLMTQMRNKIKFYLERVGHTVITDGNNDSNMILRESIGLIGKGKIAIDLHLNSHSKVPLPSVRPQKEVQSSLDLAPQLELKVWAFPVFY